MDCSHVNQVKPKDQCFVTCNNSFPKYTLICISSVKTFFLMKKYILMMQMLQFSFYSQHIFMNMTPDSRFNRFYACQNSLERVQYHFIPWVKSFAYATGYKDAAHSLQTEIKSTGYHLLLLDFFCQHFLLDGDLI